MLNHIKLLMLEQKLYHGAFGKYNRYRCWCLKRNATTTAEKLGIAKEVLASLGVTTMAAQYNELYIKRHASPTEVAVSSQGTIVTIKPAEPPQQKALKVRRRKRA
ncbi:MAG TPA: hypothetical protein PK867_31210 [Pirellulales bacterium]|nr:hypothetical protein [Pirellulales bacterium]